MIREEIIKWLESLKAEMGKSEYGALWHYAEAIDMAIEALQDRPKGEWIAVSEYGRWMRKCNSCGWKQFIDSPKMRGWHYNYCPNCGAKMERKEE